VCARAHTNIPHKTPTGCQPVDMQKEDLLDPQGRVKGVPTFPSALQSRGLQ
jgi:hypothetical protein